MRILTVCLSLMLFAAEVCAAPRQDVVLWPATPPGDEKVKLAAEFDATKESDRAVAERRVIRLTNVTQPLFTVFPAAPDKANGAAVVICPGGGHRILAYDLEGTEVAEWLNSIGVTAFVLKYRVPERGHDQRWISAVQDSQRAISLVRHRASEWNVDPQRIGICGFSAGGEAAGLTSIFGDDRKYAPIDATDAASCRPNFSVLIYTAGFYDAKAKKMPDHVRVTDKAPATFLVHAFDDGVPVQNSVQLFTALKEAGVPAELHVFDRGGHGYGLRPTKDPITRWPTLCEQWMRAAGYLTSSTAK